MSGSFFIIAGRQTLEDSVTAAAAGEKQNPDEHGAAAVLTGTISKQADSIASIT